jgi:hypothetical protein
MGMSKTDSRFLEAVKAIQSEGEYPSDRAISLALGLNQNYVGRVRNEHHSANPDALAQLSVMFKISGTWLLTGQGAMYTSSVKVTLPKGAAAIESNRERAREQAMEPTVTVYEPEPIDARMAALEKKLTILMAAFESLSNQLKGA